MPKYTLYILLCDNQTLYTGITTDLDKRYQQHCNGTAAKYTRSFKPIAILKYWVIGSDRGQAQQLEYHVKKLPRTTKEHIIQHIDSTTELINYLHHSKKLSGKHH